MPVTGTDIAYLHTCHRKLWLFTHQILMEQTSETVAEGKLIGESTYEDRPEKYRELEIGPVKIDHYEPDRKIIHEVKKSNKIEFVHIAQVKYYLFLLEEAGISGATAILEYPKLRKTHEIKLDKQDFEEIRGWIGKVQEIIDQTACPPLAKKSICRSCSYYEFCYSGEDGEQ